MADQEIDQELADKIVAHGVGESTLGDKGELYRFDSDAGSWSFDDTADKFVRDWRVCGAMLEKCLDAEIVLALITDEAMRNLGNSLPRAITEACCNEFTRP